MAAGASAHGVTWCSGYQGNPLIMGCQATPEQEESETATGCRLSSIARCAEAKKTRGGPLKGRIPAAPAPRFGGAGLGDARMLPQAAECLQKAEY